MNQSQHERQNIPTQPILVVGEYGVLNGGERSFLTVAKQLIARGWNYVAAVPSGSSFEMALQEIGVRNVGLTTHAEDGTRYSQNELRDQIAGLAEDVRPCLLHANSLSMSRLVGPLDLNVPSVGYLRDILKLSKKATADINQNDLIIAVSNATAQWHVTAGLDADRVVTIYNGVDSSVFRPLTGEGESNVDDDEAERERLSNYEVNLVFRWTTACCFTSGKLECGKVSAI